MLRTVLFVDPPAFCTAVEELVAPALRSRPIVIAPPGADRATVLALSDEARCAGISRGMPLARARKLCPRDLVILPPNPRLYARASRALHLVLRRYAPLIEPRGYGRAFLDLTGTGRLFGPAIDVAARIARESREEVRLALAAGVATNKCVSETAVRAVRTDRRTVGPSDRLDPMEIRAGIESSFLAPLSVEIFPDVPDPIRDRLEDYQLELIGEVAGLDVAQACTVFGRAGGELVWRARGVDPRPVLPPALKAEFRMEHTLATDTNDIGVLHPLLRRMTEQLGRRLRQRQLTAQRMVLDLVYADYKRGRRSLSLKAAAMDVELWDAARRAFTLACTRTVAVRTVALTVDRLAEAEVQLELFGESDRRAGGQAGGVDRQALQQAIDRIQSRLGMRGILHGMALNTATARQPACPPARPPARLTTPAPSSRTSRPVPSRRGPAPDHSYA
ncbi:MAG: hypothetical protein AB7I33_14865 [Gemmatimonadales bacterium]